ncbi:MAG: class I SAM-dependent methyltransferase [Candidatus Stahlbacteria bacterium]|nr:class I SAM-dependent methyltransferase [Candidatus Stahlbacteria bacterium]
MENLVRHQLYFKPIDKLLDSISLESKDILELGSGTGSNSLYLANTRKAGSVTLLDFSDKAFARVSTNSYPCPLIEKQADILSFHPDKSYDFVHSTGLIEHFYDNERFEVIKKHSDLCRTGGLVMIWVPVFSPAFKYISKFNRRIGIQELPFTRNELQVLCSQNKLEIIRTGETAFGALYGILGKKKV